MVYLKNTEATKVAQTLRSVMAAVRRWPSRSRATRCKEPLSKPPVRFFPGGGIIQADTASNALIITASEPVYNNVRSVIDKLDVRRPQIFVEALIVEVTAEKRPSSACSGKI